MGRPTARDGDVEGNGPWVIGDELDILEGGARGDASARDRPLVGCASSGSGGLRAGGGGGLIRDQHRGGRGQAGEDRGVSHDTGAGGLGRWHEGPGVAWNDDPGGWPSNGTGTGGGADQMARFIQGLITKHKLMAQPMVVLNKSGGAGAEGFLDAKNARPDGHKIIITLSNLFTTPLATGVPFNWKELTPVQMLALDEFVLWVNAESPYKDEP